MLKTFSKFASKSILAFVNRQLRSMRRKAFQHALASGFQRLEPRRVLTVQGVFDALTGNLSVNITPGGNTSATLGGLDATNYFLDVDGNSQFDPGSDLMGIKADLKNIFVTGTADPLGSIGSFTWKDHSGSLFQLERILASDLASISLDLVAQASFSQDSALTASDSITIVNTVTPADPANTNLRFANNLSLETTGLNGTILVNLDYQLTVDQTASFQSTQGSMRLSDIDANIFHAVARGDILDADSGVDSTDIRANRISLVSNTGSIGNSLSDILQADIATTTLQSLEIASRTPGSLQSSYEATQGTVSIHTDEFPSSVDTNKLWIVADSKIVATDLSGLSNRITDLALVIHPASMTPSSLIALPDSLDIARDLRIESHAITASDASLDLQANRILWKSVQDADLTITANQIDAESLNALKIRSTDTIRITDLDNNLNGLRANGHLAVETLQGSILVDSLVIGNQSSNVLLKTNTNGTIVANAMIQSGSGNVTFSSREALVLEDRIRTSGTGSIVLESQGSITLGATSTFTTNNTNLGVFAGGDIRFGSINAGTGSVLLASGGNISEINPSTTATQIVAQNLSMRATGRIGDADLMNTTFDNNRNAIVINATNLAARAGDSIYIQDKGVITVDRISTSLAQVEFNSTTTDRSEVLEDLTTTANNGNIKLQSLAGDITINPGTPGTAGINAHGSGDVLLQTGNSGTIVVNADIVSGSGDITLNSRGALTITDRLKTSRPGMIALLSEGTITVSALNTNGTDLGIYSTTAVVLGRIDASGASVAINAGTSISDLDSSNATLNVIATNLSMRAGTRIGNSDTGQGNVDLNRNAIGTRVDTLAASAASGIYIQEQDGVTIDRISTTIQRVNFNSTSVGLPQTLEDLTTSSNGPILLQSLAGDIRVNPGTSGTAGISAHGTGNVLLQTVNSGTILTGADIQSGTGHITLSSKGSLTIDQRLKTSGPGSLYLVSQSDLSIAGLDTNNTNLRAQAAGNLFLGNIQAGTGVVSLQAGQNISDDQSLSHPVHVTGSKLTMIAGGKIGESDTNSPANINTKTIVTQVGSIAARSGTGIYIQELDGLSIESVSNNVAQVNFRGNTTDRTQVLEDLTTSNGPVKLQSLAGSITVNAGTVGTNGITAGGSGDILLQTLNSGNITANATIASGTGNITLDAAGTIIATSGIQTGGAGGVFLSALANTSVASLITAGGSVQVLSGGDLTLGSINAGIGQVYLQASGDIKDSDPSSNSTNVIAGALAMRAGGKIGDSDTGSSSGSINRNAIGTQVSRLAAQSASGIYIQEADGLTIDTVSVSSQRVNFNSTQSTQMQVLEDLTTSIHGPIKLQSLAGSITVNAGTTGTNGITGGGSGDILLQTLSGNSGGGNISANAGIASSTGHITLDAAGTIVATNGIQTGGAGGVFLSALANTSVASLITASGSVQVLSGGDLTLGSINAGIGQVYLQASGDIKDSDPSSNSTNVVASALAMRAGGKIGDSDPGSSSGSINRNAIGTQVSRLAAQSASGIYIQETDGLTIDTVSVSSQRVNFNSTRSAQSQVLEDLTTTSNGPIKLQSLAGSITVNAGTTGTNGITAGGSGDILLQTVGNGAIVANAMIQTGTGHITLSSREALVLEDRIRTSGPGSIVLESQGSITLGATSTFTTNNTNLGVFAGGDIRIGSINAGTSSVLLASGGSISEINPSTTATQIVAQNLSMRASGRIGDADLMNTTFDNNRNAIVINATNLAARAGDSIYIQDKGVITVDRISTSLAKVEFNSTTSDRSEVLEDLTTTANNGNIKLQSLAGDITINPGTPGTAGISAHGSGDVLLQTGNSGTIVVNADIVSGSGDITLNSRGSMSVSDRLKTSRPGMIALISEGTITVSALNTNGVDLGVFSTTGILLGSIRAEGASVSMSAGTSISDLDSSNATLNVIATNLSMRAGTRIGNSDTGQSNVDLNRNAISTRVDKLAASAASGIYIQEQDGVTIDRISTTIQRVNFNSTSVGLPQNLEDLTTTNNGPIKLQSLAGSITVRAGTVGTNGISANGSGDILLETVNGGDITTHSGISSGTGSITLDAAGALDLKGMVQTLGTGSIQLASGTNTSIESIRTLGNVQILSGGDLTLGSIDAGNGRVYMQAVESISDRDTTSNSTSVIAGSLAMRAGGKIGDSDTGAPDGSNRNAIGTQVLTLAAEAATGIYIQERDGLRVDSVVVSSQRVNFNSTRTAQVRVLEDLTTTSDGPIKLQSLAGDLVVNAGTMGTRGIAAGGSGDVLLETVQVGSIITNAVVMSDQGNITVNSADSLQVVDRLRTGVSGTIYLKSQSDVAVGSLEANNDIAVIAGGSITLGRLNAGSGVVYLEAAGNILDSDPSAQTIHVSALALAMRSGGKIGDSDLTYPQDSNRNAIVTQVGLIAAESANGMYVLQQEGGIVVDTVSVGVKQVNFNSTLADRSETLEDLVTTANGPIKLQSISGDILVRGGTAGTLGIRADGTGDVLLQTVLNGSVITQAQVQSSTGNITIDSVDALQVRDHLRTSNPGRIFLTSRGDVTVEALNTGNVNLAIVSDQSIRLGDIQAGTARVYLQASKDILDADPNSESINLSANALAMSAGGRIGGSDLAGPLETNRNAIGTKVDLLAARSVEGIYIREADGLTVDTVLVSSSQVNFNSSQSDRSQVLEDLTTTGSGPIKLQSVAGNIQINSGSTGPYGILSAVAGDVLLQTIDSGTVILNGVVQSEYGDITIQSKDHLVLGDRIRLGGPPGLGTIYLASQQDVTIESLMTNDSNLWVQAGRDIVLGSIQAGVAGVYLDAQRDIVNGAIVPVVNVSTRGVLAMRAGSEIGEIFTQVDTLAAVAADRITITEIDGVTIGAVQVAVEQVHFNSSQTDRVSVLEDLTTSNGGTIALRNLTGDIIVDSGRLPGTGISADGAGDIVLVTIDSGHIILRGDLVSGTGDISLGAKDSVLIGAMIRTSGDVVLESVRGAIAELNSSARVEADELTLRSASFAHLHDTTVNRLTARTLSNALLSSWQELDVQANAQGDDFVDALGTVSQSIKDALREQYRYIDRYENIGYSLYVVNSKALTIDSAVAGILSSGQGQSDKPGIYIQTRSGDLVVEDAIVSSSTSAEAGGVVLVSGSKVVLGSTATLQSNSIQNGTIHGQLINDVDLKARIFDALEKPNPAGGLFTTRIVSRNSFSESNLPEVPTSPGPTKRSLQGVATHFGSANESGFDLYIGYADGKLESFGKQGDIFVRDTGSDQPVGSKPQSLGRVGYLERSNPFDVDFLNSVQELPTDVVIRRSEDFFIFQKEPPAGFDNFNPPNGAPSTSTGYYDLTVQTHRVPDVISEGSDSGLPMPPARETPIPTFSLPEPYTVRETPTVATESPEYEDQPYQERSTRIVVKRLVVSIVEEVKGEFKEQEGTKESRTDETEEILIPEGLLSGSDQLSQSDLRKIREYLRLQPGTRQGIYEITIETSDGTPQVVDRFPIRTEPRGANPTIPLDNSPNEPSKGEPQKGESPEGDQEAKAKENDGKPSNSNDQSLYLEPGIPTSIVPSELRHEQASDQAWSLVLGSLWLARKPNSLNVPPPTDYSVLARRLRRFRSPNQK